MSFEIAIEKKKRPSMNPITKETHYCTLSTEEHKRLFK